MIGISGVRRPTKQRVIDSVGLRVHHAANQLLFLCALIVVDEFQHILVPFCGEISAKSTLGLSSGDDGIVRHFAHLLHRPGTPWSDSLNASRTVLCIIGDSTRALGTVLLVPLGQRRSTTSFFHYFAQTSGKPFC